MMHLTNGTFFIPPERLDFHIDPQAKQNTKRVIQKEVELNPRIRSNDYGSEVIRDCSYW